MVVQPRLVGVLLRGRSAWKGLAETDYFVLQNHPRRISNAFRIITRGFPHYRVAEGDSVELLQEELEFLSRMARVSIQGKITSKKISTWLKSTFERNSILAIESSEGRLTSPLDRQEQLNLRRLHDLDGYLSDSSLISNGEAYSAKLKTHRPLRRAVSLEDLTSIRHHLLSSALTSQSSPKQLATVPKQHSGELSQHSLQLTDPIERPASSASLYHRRQRAHPGTSEMEASIESLQGQPHSITPIKIEIYDQEGHGSLPTPDISPGELSESSDELVIIQGDFLDEVRSVDQVQPLQIQYGSFPEAGVDAAVTGDASQNGEAVAGPLSWLTESPFIDALVNWIEGPENPGLQKSNEKEKPNPWLDIPLQFIALLTYPEPDPKNGNKMTLALVRETAFVRQRRKTLMMLTLYTLLVRYCSFDTFIAILFASNCAMLFLMKNSGRMNVNMAKRAVRQRVGWAKQWAGSIFKRGGGGGGNNNNNTNSAGISNSHSGSSTSQHLGAGASSSSASNINRQIQSSALSGGVVASPTLTPDNSSQMKRRGLFGKRKTVDNASTIQVASSSSSRVFTPSIASGAQDKYAVTGDGASIISAAPTGATSGTQKKRFFRRGNTSNSTSNGNSGNTISSTSASTASAPVPIPSKRNTLSIISHTAPQHLGPSTSATKSAITNTPLSSSPLAQSHSFKSPMSHEGEMDRVDSKWTMSQSMVSTPPPPLSGINLTQNSKGSITSQDSTTTSSLSSPGASSGQSTPITCESVAMPIPASTPLMVSGLSQLLGRSYPTATKDRSLIERGHWEDNSARGYDGHEEEQRVNASRGKDIGSISFHNEMETMSKHSHGGRDNAKANLTLDAVTSASAESMEGV